MSGKAPQSTGQSAAGSATLLQLYHLAWLIGGGQEWRRTNPENKDNPDLKHSGFAPLVPSQTLTCRLFEAKKR